MPRTSGDLPSSAGLLTGSDFGRYNATLLRAYACLNTGVEVRAASFPYLPASAAEAGILDELMHNFQITKT